MALTLTLLTDYPHSMGREVPYDIALADSGNYTTGGDVVDFTTLPLIKASRPPVNVEFQLPAGFSAQWIRATPDAINTGKAKFFSASGTEITGGAAYPAGLHNGDMRIRAYFKKNL